MSGNFIEAEVTVDARCMQITNALSQTQREALFLQAFPNMQAVIALAPSIVQSHLNKIARMIDAAEQKMNVRYEGAENIYLACENANKKLVTDGLNARGLAPRNTERTH